MDAACGFQGTCHLEALETSTFVSGLASPPLCARKWSGPLSRQHPKTVWAASPSPGTSARPSICASGQKHEIQGGGGPCPVAMPRGPELELVSQGPTQACEEAGRACWVLSRAESFGCLRFQPLGTQCVGGLVEAPREGHPHPPGSVWPWISHSTMWCLGLSVRWGAGGQTALVGTRLCCKYKKPPITGLRSYRS